MGNNKESEFETTYEKGLSNPDLSIGGFELWVYGRQFPHADDYWDGNWLYARTRCTADYSVVEAGGPIIHLSELQGFMVECKQIYDTLEGEAHLRSMEPNVRLKITMESRGRCELFVSITPNHLYQDHSFIFDDLDQSYLPPLIKNLEQILDAYPLKGRKEALLHK